MAAHLIATGQLWAEVSKYTGIQTTGTWTNMFALTGISAMGQMFFAHGYLNGNNGGQGYHSYGWAYNSWASQPVMHEDKLLYNVKLRVNGDYIQFQQSSGATQNVTAHLWRADTRTFT